MEELQTKTMALQVGGKTVHCEIKERDFGDLIVFDVFSKDNYLFTITQKGDVLFNHYEVENQQNVMDPRQLNEIIDQVKEKIESDPNNP
jgi:hypothetical protein